jgi:hypothetical protein
MLGYYFTPLLILQAFCAYHAYRNNAEQRWYWLIIFFPVIGCVIYIIHNFSGRSTVQNLAEGVKGVVNSNYKIEQLEKTLRFADNVTNRINLADAYVQVGRFQDALALYKECLQGFMADDPTLRMKVLHTSFMARDFVGAIEIGDGLLHEKSFKNSDARISYAWALYHDGKIDKSREVFRDMNKSFTNYVNRLEYCRFLLATKDHDELKNVLTELLEEFEHMKGPERRVHREIIRQVREIASMKI